jgi:hypothetical protein
VKISLLTPIPPRIVCSAECGEVIELLLEKSAQSAEVSGFCTEKTGGLSAGAVVVAWFMLTSPFLIWFTRACAAMLILSGIWHQRGARRSFHPN